MKSIGQHTVETLGAPGASTIHRKNVDGGPLGGGAGDSRAATIYAKKHRWWVPWRWCRRSESAHHQC
jgi:hypothetical protein